MLREFIPASYSNNFPIFFTKIFWCIIKYMQRQSLLWKTEIITPKTLSQQMTQVSSSSLCYAIISRNPAVTFEV